MRMAGDGGGYSALAASVGGQAFSAEVDNLKTFKTRVDQMLDDLEGSPASQKQIAEQKLGADHLGTGFGEASDLLAAYHTVHANLETLSKTLSQQIEAMSITLDVSTKGYRSVEESRLDELWKIRDETEAANQRATPGAHGPAAPASLTGPRQGRV